ncbi:MAG: YlqD family protein [Selenomonadaceae bacterium]|nr:YlqD family protein [Selenomonadaceae bacterium]MBR1858436.1 YlqD family protein [Selenomonadaceae bacterium]
MDSIAIQVPVTIKAKLTEKLRTKILDDINKSVEQAELEIKQINIQQERALSEQGDTPQKEAAIRRHFGPEIQKRQQFCAESAARKENLEKLAVGAEIIQGTLQRQVELKIGDDMREIMNVEVLIEDDKIIAIRS